MAVKGIPRDWKFIGEAIGCGNLYRTSYNSWEVVNVLYGKRIPGKFDGDTFSRESLVATFKYLGVLDLGYTAVKQWVLRPQVAVDKLQAIAQENGEYV